MYGEKTKTKSLFNKTKREKRKGVGMSHHSTPELQLQTHYADHLKKSFKAMLMFCR